MNYETPCRCTHELPDEKGNDAILVCPICKQNVGVFNTKTTSLPINPRDFQSLCIPHQFPRPGIPWAIVDAQADQWKYVQCGMYGCINLLFVNKLTGEHVTEIMTTEGPWKIGSGEVPKVLTQEEINKAKTEQVCDMWGPRVEEQIEEGAGFEDIPGPIDGEGEYPCRHCDKSYNHAQSRYRHEKKCKGKRKHG